MYIRYAVSLVAATMALLVAVLPSLASGDTLANARDATAIYNDPTAAVAGGYELLTDKDGIACIDLPGTGTMGVHYVKGALIQSGVIDAARPQALVYEVQPSGKVSLVALEYVVIQSVWDGAHSGVPTLFGQKFMLTPAGNRFGLPAFYSLHTWIWKHNPKGTFEAWNPQVHCVSRVNGVAASDEAANVADDGMGLMGAMPTDDAAMDSDLGNP